MFNINEALTHWLHSNQKNTIKGEFYAKNKASLMYFLLEMPHTGYVRAKIPRISINIS